MCTNTNPISNVAKQKGVKMWPKFFKLTNDSVNSKQYSMNVKPSM